MTQRIKSRQYMMVQDMDKLPYDLDKLKDILSGLKAKEWAYIKHDKDKSENGGLVTPHVHAVIKFENERMLDTLAKTLKVEPQYLQVKKYNYIFYCSP